MQLRYRARNERFAVNIVATVFRSSRSAVVATITDMSFEGCQLCSEADFVIGERLRLNVQGQGTVLAEVRWALDGRAGAKFLAEPAA